MSCFKKEDKEKKRKGKQLTVNKIPLINYLLHYNIIVYLYEPLLFSKSVKIFN